MGRASILIGRRAAPPRCEASRPRGLAASRPRGLGLNSRFEFHGTKSFALLIQLKDAFEAGNCHLLAFSLGRVFRVKDAFEAGNCHLLAFSLGRVFRVNRKVWAFLWLLRYGLQVLAEDTVSEWLRRWTRNPLGSARKGSNPFGVDAQLGFGGHATRITPLAN